MNKKKSIITLIFLTGLTCQAYALDIDTVKIRLLEGNYKAAITEGEKLVASVSSSTPGIDELYYVLGLSYMKDGNYLRASDIFEIILHEHKNSRFKEEAAMGLGDTYLLREDFIRAEAVYKQILQDNPNSKLKSQLYYRLSQTGFKKGELAKGKEYLGKIKEQAPLAAELKNGKETSIVSGELSSLYYSVQVGAFSKKENAYNLTKRLSDKDYPAYVEEARKGEKIMYRVKVGKLNSREEAVQLQKKLSGEGYPTKICP